MNARQEHDEVMAIPRTGPRSSPDRRSLAALVGDAVLIIAVGVGTTSSWSQSSFSSAVSLGTVDIGPLRQASGIAASRNNEAVLWTHNDAGEGPQLYAIDTRGRLLGVYQLPNATKVDYEDIASGPGPKAGVQYLFVGDIGDNNASRNNIVVFRIPEPAVYLTQAVNPPTRTIKGLHSIVLTYPDGARNAESLMVDPLTGDLFIASKEAGRSRIYSATKAQLEEGGPITLSFIREIEFDLASGGDISPNGEEIILRQEDFAHLWRRAPGQAVGDALGGAPISIPVVGRPAEPNGEAIGFDDLGNGYFTLSDSANTQPLYYFQRTSAHAKDFPLPLVSSAATWRFLDTGTNPGTGWRTNGYDDSAWKNGDAQFGYGDNDEQTLVSFGKDSNNKFITTCFRKTFVVANAAACSRLDLKLLFDDGVAAYLNGTAVVIRNLLPDYAFNTPAGTVQEDLEDTWFTFAISPSLLVTGTNILAVEVHQAAVDSLDLSFDAQLVGWTFSRPFILSTTCQPGRTLQLAVGGTGTGVAVECSTNLASWTPLGVIRLTNGLGSFTDTNAPNFSSRFYRLSR